MQFTMTITGPKDALGRCSFDLEWTGTEWRKDLAPNGEPVGFARGQCYFANPEETAARIRSRGDLVEVRYA